MNFEVTLLEKEPLSPSPEHRFCRERISRWRPWSKVRCSCLRNTTLRSTLAICRDRLLSSAMAESGERERETHTHTHTHTHTEGGNQIRRMRLIFIVYSLSMGLFSNFISHCSSELQLLNVTLFFWQRAYCLCQPCRDGKVQVLYRGHVGAINKVLMTREINKKWVKAYPCCQGTARSITRLRTSRCKCLRLPLNWC